MGAWPRDSRIPSGLKNLHIKINWDKLKKKYANYINTASKINIYKNMKMTNELSLQRKMNVSVDNLDE